MSDLLDKVKQAKEQAADLAGRAAEGASGLKEQAAAKASQITEQAAAKAAELRETGTHKVVESIEALNGALPVMKEAGFDVANVAIELGLPPRVIATFTLSHEISEEKFTALLDTHAEHKFTVLLLGALRQAWRIETKIKIVGMQARSIAVEIGLTPSVTISFR